MPIPCTKCGKPAYADYEDGLCRACTATKPMSEADKEWIDNANYEQLLSKWRHAPAGDPMFRGLTGEYYQEVLARKKREVGQDAHVSASKKIG